MARPPYSEIATLRLELVALLTIVPSLGKVRLAPNLGCGKVYDHRDNQHIREISWAIPFEPIRVRRMVVPPLDCCGEIAPHPECFTLLVRPSVSDLREDALHSVVHPFED